MWLGFVWYCSSIDCYMLARCSKSKDHTHLSLASGERRGGLVPPHVSSRACHWKIDLPCNIINFSTLLEVWWRAKFGKPEQFLQQLNSLFACLGTSMKIKVCDILFVVCAPRTDGAHFKMCSNPLHGRYMTCSGISTAHAVILACWLSRAFATWLLGANVLRATENVV